MALHVSRSLASRDSGYISDGLPPDGEVMDGDASSPARFPRRLLCARLRDRPSPPEPLMSPLAHMPSRPGPGRGPDRDPSFFGAVQQKLQRWHYQYEVTFAFYMLEPAEKRILNAIVLALCGLVVYGIAYLLRA